MPKMSRRRVHRFVQCRLSPPLRAWVLALGLAWALPAAAEAELGSSPVDRHPDYPCLVALLQQLLDADGPGGTNTFHIGRVIEHPGRDHDTVRVYWPRSQAILLVQLGRAGCADPRQRHDDLALDWYRGKARIDLRRDVVADEAAMRGSSYLVSRPWVDEVVRDARERGVALTLRRASWRARRAAAAQSL